MKLRRFASTKFVLVGVSQTLPGVLDDHASLERQVAPVLVPRMSGEECCQAIRKSMAMLQAAGVEIRFDDAAVAKVAQAAAGLPWFVHVLGQEALLLGFDSGKSTVGVVEVEEAISWLATNRFAQHFSDRNQMAVRESRQREIVLRVLASWQADESPLQEIYRRAKRLDIRNPSVSKKDLMLARHRHVIEAPALRGTGVVRFRNASYKRYENLRSALFLGVDDDVSKHF